MAIGNSIGEQITGVVGFTGTAFTATPVTNHGVVLGGSTSSTLGNVGPTATSGQVLQSAGSSADPAFSTATYPATTTVSQILYSSATNVVGGITTANNGVLITSTSGVPSILANGTTGQVLTATTGSTPSWAPVSTSTGNRTLIQSQNASNSATIDFTTGITGYTYYEIEFLSVILADNNIDLAFRVSTDGGSSFSATTYENSATPILGITGTSSASTTYVALVKQTSNSAGLANNGYVRIYDITSTSLHKAFLLSSEYSNGATAAALVGGAKWKTTTAVNAFRFLAQTGNISSGTFRLFGIS